jgi:hypothetical protein
MIDQAIIWGVSMATAANDKVEWESVGFDRHPDFDDALKYLDSLGTATHLQSLAQEMGHAPVGG